MKLAMKYAVIASTKDNASMNIRDSMLENYRFDHTEAKFRNEFIYSKGNLSIYTLSKELIVSECIDKEIQADYFIFISKHQSKAKIPSLTVHSIGNWGMADLGGRSNILVKSSAVFQRDLYRNLHRFCKTDKYDIVNEVTHHGPFLEKPAIFIEIGSTDEEWSDKDAGKIIATTIMNTVNEEREKVEVAVGLGGLHTCNNFNKLIKNSKIAIAHFCPKHMLRFLDSKMIEEAIRKTIEPVKFILLDWKGLKQDKQRIVNELDSMRLAYKRTSDF